MTHGEIEKKAFEVFPKPNRCDYPNDDEYGNAIIVRSIQREGYIKALEEIESMEKVHGWVARDSVEDAFNGCGLILHYKKPWRTGGEWSNLTIAMHLPWNMFPDLKWEDEPIEVELTIKSL